jgi:hypothetical protein
MPSTDKVPGCATERRAGAAMSDTETILQNMFLDLIFPSEEQASGLDLMDSPAAPTRLTSPSFTLN